MSPPRRRSKRIASASKRTQASPAPQLEPLAEHDEAPEDQQPKQKLATVMSSPAHHPTTPSSATPVKLPMSEMHPSKVHPSMAAPSSGLKLGFSDIDYTKQHSNEMPGVVHATPSKTPAPSTAFTFRHERPGGDLGLGPEAQKIMQDLREEAAKIKADLAATREKDQDEGAGRKIAKAKGKASRFSAAHMAEFKKMDSIEGHPSAFRAAPGRVTPMKAGVKRSQSKANLDEPDSARSKKSTPRPVPKSVEKASEKSSEEPQVASKRVRQRLEDDATTLRPVARDDSAIPRPKSSGNDSVRSGIPRSQTLGSLMTPTKSSLARLATSQALATSPAKSPTKPETGSLIKSPSKVDLGGGVGVKPPSKFGLGLMKSATTNNLNLESGGPATVQTQTPGRFGKIKSILKKPMGGSRFKSNIPHFASSIPKTPAHQKSTDKELPPIPVTTPGRKFGRRVDFTPDTKQVDMVQNSPSPIKTSLSRSLAVSKLELGNQPPSTRATPDKGTKGEVSYPDLSAYCQEVNTETEEDKPEPLPQSVPGTFTFRSDHTIRFDGTSPNGFGAAAGQASIRQVHESMASPVRMPGSFPIPRSKSPNKENKDPGLSLGFPHGMTNKKRHRPSWDEEEEEQKHAAKKVRQEPPAEGHAVVAPRLAAAKSSPIKRFGGFSRTPSPQKKRTGMTLSRLNMLAQPKIRK
ncbi:hypothetical protein F4809DRAFT_293856 [Biscogniauxia mediterranea]|nr:hypothetical protein F4809DRAFT_293856 [Biscogniauxia mediterranea]